jgi:hypothetical protein
MTGKEGSEVQVKPEGSKERVILSRGMHTNVDLRCSANPTTKFSEDKGKKGWG